MIPPADSAQIETIRELLRGAGLRCTAARLAVVQRLMQVDAPISHAELADDLTPLGFDKATVFRNLSDLTEADLVTRSELGDHVWRFELKDPRDPEAAAHPHFVCLDCGRVTCLAGVEFNAATKRRAREVGRVTEVLLKGRCNDCA